jgi:hypothetical protein
MATDEGGEYVGCQTPRYLRRFSVTSLGFIRSTYLSLLARRSNNKSGADGRIKISVSNNSSAVFLQMNQTVSQSGDPDCHLANSWEGFKNQFAPAECTPPDQLGDKGRLLVVIHRAIESIRPGSIGVAASAFSAEGKRLAAEPHYVDDADMQFRLAQNRQNLHQEALKNMMRMQYEMATKTIIEPALPRKD